MSLSNVAFKIVQVTELDRVGRTRVLASGGDFIGTDFSFFDFRLDLARLNSLNAVGAFFHDTAAADGDFGVHHQVLQFSIALRNLVGTRIFEEGLGIAVVEEIESPHFIRTVVAAIPSADTAVVNHVVEALAAVYRRGDGTNGFTRSIFAMMTGDRLVDDLNFVRRYLFFVGRGKIEFGIEVVAVIAINSHPMHFSPSPNFVLADDRNVVFGLACHNT